MDTKRCRIAEKAQERLAKFFVASVTVRRAPDLLGMNHKTAAYFYRRLRNIIAAEMEKHLRERANRSQCKLFRRLQKGQRVAAGSKIPVWPPQARRPAYTLMIPNTNTTKLLEIIRKNIVPDQMVYSDSDNAYRVLDVSEFKHFRIDDNNRYVKDGHNHTNGIENFWN